MFRKHWKCKRNSLEIVENNMEMIENGKSLPLKTGLGINSKFPNYEL